MTPFDVIKTRLQTQPPRLPAAFDSLHNSPWPPPVPSTSKLPIECCKAPSVASASTAGRTGRAGPAKYFNPSAGNPSATAAELLCRFDPRVSRATLPAAGAHGASVAASSRGTAAAAAAAAAGAHQYLHHFAAVPLSGSSGGAIACLYPASTGHASLSLPYHLSHASSFAAPAPASIAPNHAHHRYLTGFTDALAHIVKSEGVTALWRGTAPALVMSVPGQVVYMVGYDSLRRTAFDSAPAWAQRGAGRPATTSPQDGERPPLRASYVTAVPLLAGALSRTVVAVLLSPLELVRTQIQSHVPSSSSTGQPQPRASLATLLRDLKWSNAWRGLTPTLWRDVPFSGIYWAGYEAIKRSLTGGRGMGETLPVGGNGDGTMANRGQISAIESSRASDFGIAFVSGAGSGMVSYSPFLSCCHSRSQLPRLATHSSRSGS